MIGLLRHIQAAVRAGNVEVSEHAYERMVERFFDVEEVLAGVQRAILIEDYTESRGEPRILVQQRASSGAPYYAVWEAPEEMKPIVLLVTAYRPD